MKLSGSIFGALLLAFCVSPLLVLAAGDDPVWRPINPADLAQTESRVEKGADAEAIFWEVRLDDKKSSELAHEHYVRVKIFTERGRERFSKFDIPFLKGRKIKDVAARVVKPDGSIIELKPEEVFEREIVKTDGLRLKAMSFAMAGIEPGVILEYRYREIVKRDSLNGERLIFQRDIPIQRASYFIRPYEGQMVQMEKFNTAQDFGFTKGQNGFTVATMTDVPAFKDEPYMPPADEVRSWALIYYSGFFSQQGWGNLAQGFSTIIKDVMKPSGEVKKTAAEVTAGAASNEDKVKKIYEYVQTNIKNVVFDASIPTEQKEKLNNKNPGDTLKRRMGDSQDIEMLFASLVTAAGLEARVVLAGDRSEFFFIPERHTHRSFVHPACIAVNLDGKWRYFNPGTPFLPFGKLVWYEEDVPTILVGDNLITNARSPLTQHDQTTAKRTGKFKLLEDGTLEGSFRIEYAGQNAINRRRDGFSDSEQKRLDDFKDTIKARIGAAEVSDITLENFGNTAAPLVYAGKIRVPNYAQKTGKRLIVQPGFFEFGAQSVFTAETRRHQIYFPSPWSEIDEVEIEMPVGYALDNAETPAQVSDSNQIGMDKIAISVVKDKNLLVYKRDFHFGKGGYTLFPASAYPILKKMFDEFHKADSHSLVLKQAK